MIQNYVNHLLFKAMLDMHENNNSKYRSISALKHHVGVLGKKIAEESVQLHGGMGVSEEMSIGHYLKNLLSLIHNLEIPNIT